MLYITATIFGAFLFAVGNIIDKFLVSKLFKDLGIGAIMIYSSLVIGCIMAPVFLVFSGFNIAISLTSILVIFVSSILYVLSCYLYFIALDKDDASSIVAIFQVIPVFSYILGFIFLDEILTLQQILASILIVSSAIMITLDFNEQDKTAKKEKRIAIINMLLASLCIAVSFLIFKVYAQDLSFATVAFWEQIGFIICGSLMFIFIKAYRNSFIGSVKQNGRKALALNLTNELINLLAKVLVNFGSLGMALSLAWVLNSFQPLFVFLIAAGLTILFPKICKEDISKKVVIKKLFFMLLICLGMALLYL